MLCRMLQCFCNPGIQAGASLLGGNVNLAVQVRWQTDHEFAGEWFFRRLRNRLSWQDFIYRKDLFPMSNRKNGELLFFDPVDDPIIAVD